MFKVNNKDNRMTSLTINISIVNFEQVTAGCVKSIGFIIFRFYFLAKSIK